MIHFFVPGIPKPAGSKRAFHSKKTGKTWVIDASKNQDWKGDVKRFAVDAIENHKLLGGPIKLTVSFFLPRPKSHFNKRGLKPSVPMHPTTRPDCLKLARCVEDALTGIIWRDDSQIYHEVIEKWYSDRPGAEIYVEG